MNEEEFLEELRGHFLIDCQACTSNWPDCNGQDGCEVFYSSQRLIKGFENFCKTQIDKQKVKQILRKVLKFNIYLRLMKELGLKRGD